MINVEKINNREIIQKIKFLVITEKKNLADQIVLLREIKRRKLALALGYPGLFSFCEHELNLSKNQAWKRSQAATAIEQEPRLLDMLKNGATSVSNLAIVATKLSEKTTDEIRAFIPKKSKREVEAFISNLNRDGSRSAKEQTVKLSVEVNLQTFRDFKNARKLLGQNRLDITEGQVLAEALDLLFEKKDPARKAQRAMDRLAANATHKMGPLPKTAPDPIKRPDINKIQPQQKRYIPAKVRHAVHSAPERQCKFVGVTGKQCPETAVLQIDHIQMYCRGGDHREENLRLLCSAHNRYEAEKKLGGASYKRPTPAHIK